jgi:nicotinate-nucleotide adenylyltransferase
LKIALLGGTFNPVHLGHLLIAENARNALGLDKVLLIPCSQPPHKCANHLVAASHRLKMLQLAIAGKNGLEISDLEIKRGGTSYTIETLEQLQRLHPQDQLSVIVGSDLFSDVGLWRRFSDIVKIAEFLVMERPGSKLTTPPSSVSADELPHLRFKVFTGPSVQISSSDIRRDIKDGKNVSHLLPSPVYDYIEQEKLYR